MITAADIKDRLSERPFSPFRIVTSSGKEYNILHPEFLMVGKRVLGIGTPKKEGDEEIDGIHVISVLHITALESLAAQAKKK